jgi:hypothetical protein
MGALQAVQDVIQLLVGVFLQRQHVRIGSSDQAKHGLAPMAPVIPDVGFPLFLDKRVAQIVGEELHSELAADGSVRGSVNQRPYLFS